MTMGVILKTVIASNAKQSSARLGVPPAPGLLPRMREEFVDFYVVS
jgi:hypothetical protein